MAQEEVEKRLSIEELALEYQRELWQRHYYQYYEDEGDADDEDNAEDEHIAAVEGSLGDAESSTRGMSPGQVIDISSNICLPFPPPPKGYISPATPPPPPPPRASPPTSLPLASKRHGHAMVSSSDPSSGISDDDESLTSQLPRTITSNECRWLGEDLPVHGQHQFQSVKLRAFESG